MHESVQHLRLVLLFELLGPFRRTFGSKDRSATQSGQKRGVNWGNKSAFFYDLEHHLAVSGQAKGKDSIPNDGLRYTVQPSQINSSFR